MTILNIGFDPEVIMFRVIVTASLVSLALDGCTAQSLAPSQRADTANKSPYSIRVDSGFIVQSPTAILQWNPKSVKMTDAGPYAPTALKYTHGDTVVVNYDQPCGYRVDFDLHPGPIIHNIETDGYNFYAYSGKTGSPAFHCKVTALLKNAAGRVIAHDNLSVTITYPKKHAHGG